MTPKTIAGVTIYSLLELAEMLNITVITLRRYIKAGKIRGRKIGGNEWFVTEEALAEFLRGEENQK